MTRSATLERAETARPVWELATASFLPPSIRADARPWIRRLPLILVLVVQTVLSARLIASNDAFADEALYSNAGHVLWDHLLTGSAVPDDYGQFFSGAPYAYPLLSAALDTVGGLSLIRAFSLVCMLAATVALSAVGRHLWGPRGAVLVAASFVSVGPVMFVGAFGTFDALCVALLSVALWLGMTRRSSRSAAVLGLVLAAAVVIKYTSAAYVPIVLAAALLSGPRMRVGRVVLAGAVAAAVLAGLYLGYGEGVRGGILFTTTGREALSEAPTTQLLYYVLVDVGVVLALAVVGGMYGSWRRGLLTLTLLAGGLLLPLAQLRLGEAVSFEKHLAYSALFLAPLAGRALVLISRRTLGVVLIFALLWSATVLGLSRSHAMFEQWAPVRGVIALVERQPTPGRYLSNQAPSMAYYTREDHPDIRWEEHYALYDSGESAMVAAVEDRTYQLIALKAGSSGNPVEDDHNDFFIRTLDASPDYELVTPPFPTRQYSTDRWLVFHRVQTGG